MGQAIVESSCGAAAREALHSPAPSWATIAKMVETRADGSWRLTELGRASAQKLAAHAHTGRGARPSVG